MSIISKARELLNKVKPSISSVANILPPVAAYRGIKQVATPQWQQRAQNFPDVFKLKPINVSPTVKTIMPIFRAPEAINFVGNMPSNMIRGYGKTAERITTPAGRKEIKTGFSQLLREKPSINTLSNPFVQTALDISDFIPGIGLIGGGVREVGERGARELAEQSVKRAARGAKPALQQAKTATREGLQLNPKLISSSDNMITQGVKLKPEKGFLKTVKGSPQTTEVLKKEVEELNQFYKTLKNKAVIKRVKKEISTNPELVRQQILTRGVPVSADKAAAGVLLVKKYEKAGLMDQALEIVESLDSQLRDAGRFIQASSLWNKLSPESMVRLTDKLGAQYGAVITDEIRNTVRNRYKEIFKMAEGTKKTSATRDLMNFIADQMPLKFGEKLDAYRYTNMLSGARTQARNIFSNTLNTFVTRPLDLIGEAVVSKVRGGDTAKLEDVGTYYSKLFDSFGQAWKNAKTSFKEGDNLTKYNLEESNMAIQAARRSKMPKVLRAVPNFLNAQDTFFSTLIQAGEMERLIKSGTKIEDATVAAKNLAEKYLYRNKLGEKEIPTISRAIDQIGATLLSKNIPGRKYIAPFINVPINVGKFMVEHSPLGFIGKGMDNAQYGKAVTGSMASIIGAMFALSGKTTWEAPTDPKKREAFYASGRKPYSVLIGNQWVPLWYFGPFALALGAPAAIKDTYMDPSNIGKTDLQKGLKVATKLSKMIISQTPLEGVQGALDILTGKEEWNIEKFLGMQASQFIPAQGLLRNIANIIDPTFRKTKTFDEYLRGGIPGLKNALEPYTEPSGLPSKTTRLNQLLPYDIMTNRPGYGKILELRNNVTAFNKLDTQAKELFKQGKIEEAKKIITDNADLFRKGSSSTKLMEPINKLQSFGEKVNADKRLTPEQKQKVLKDIETKMMKIVGEEAPIKKETSMNPIKPKEVLAAEKINPPKSIDSNLDGTATIILEDGSKLGPYRQEDVDNIFNKLQDDANKKRASMAPPPTTTTKVKPTTTPLKSGALPHDDIIDRVFGKLARNAKIILTKENAKRKTGKEIDIPNRIDPKTGKWSDSAPILIVQNPITKEKMQSIDRGLFRINNRTFLTWLGGKEERKRLYEAGIIDKPYPYRIGLTKKEQDRAWDAMLDPEKNTKFAKLLYDYWGPQQWAVVRQGLVTLE